MVSRLVDEEIRSAGRITVARFMELALYHPEHGYYATAARRSGRAGDFYTNVDVGPFYGAALARLASRAWHVLGEPASWDLVEAGAGNGQLARDLLDALRVQHPACERATRLTLVDTSAAARHAQIDVLASHADRLAARRSDLPDRIDGMVYANELLDAFPVHRVRMTPAGLVEIYVGGTAGRRILLEGPPSTPALARYLADLHVSLQPGAETDVPLAAVAWCQRAASVLTRGYLLIVDYGDSAPRLHGAAEATGTLRAFGRHLVDAPAGPWPAWLDEPGQRDITSHVDFTAVEAAFARSGLVRHTFVDQTRFLLALGLLDDPERSARLGDTPAAALRARLQRRALLAPEGLGGHFRALLMGTRDAPALNLPFEAPWAAVGTFQGN